MSGRGVDFFISHAGRDTGWAEWLAWQLEQAGYTVELDVWDWAPGEDFVARMSAALERADRLLAVCTHGVAFDHDVEPLAQAAEILLPRRACPHRLDATGRLP